MSNSGVKASELIQLPCGKLRDYPLRGEWYDQNYLENLCHSIKDVGLLDPIVVRPEEKAYQVLSGHYRLRALRRLAWREVTCQVMNCSSQEGLLIYCTSNIYTRTLSAIEEAHLLNILLTDGKLTYSQAGALFGHGNSWVSRRLKLLGRLEPSLVEDVHSGLLKPRFAQELARLPRGNEQQRVLSVIRKKALNKNEAADLITRWLDAAPEEKVRLEQESDSSSNQELPGMHVKAMYYLRRMNSHTEELRKMLPLIESSDWLSAQFYSSFQESIFRLLKELEVKRVENV